MTSQLLLRMPTLMMTLLPVVVENSPEFSAILNFRIIDLLQRQLKDESLLESKLFEDALLVGLLVLLEGLQLIEFLESALYICLNNILISMNSHQLNAEANRKSAPTWMFFLHMFLKCRKNSKWNVTNLTTILMISCCTMCFHMTS